MLSSFLLAGAASAQLLDPLIASTGGITKRCPGDVLPPAQFSLALGSKVKRPAYKHAAYENLRSQLKNEARVGPYTQSVAGSDLDEEYITNITSGGQHFSVIVDTGSSDTWLIEEGFDCFTLADKPVSQAHCAFGPVYDPEDSSTYKKIADRNFNISYGDGEFLTGTMAKETVSIAGMTVKNQKIGVVNKASWLGDGISSGLMGLAYRDLTSQFNGTNPDLDTFTGPKANWIPYSPLFYTAIKEGVLKESLLSVALNRGTFKAENSSTYDPNLGYIAFGGIAPVAVENISATVPIQKLNTSIGDIYAYYTVDVKYNFPGTHDTAQQAILDTGTTLNYIPTHAARAFNEAFDPPATWDAADEIYLVNCTAKVPKFDVILDGTSFPIAAADQILPIGTDSKGKTICMSGTQPGGTIESGSIFILGDTFLHNVVMTFNPQHEEVTITQRKPY